jgi:guanylate kinase
MITLRRGLVFLLASPSGAGKSTLTNLLLKTETDISLSVSVTTRERRKSEVDGVHYHFIDEKRFLQMRDGGELLEWAEVHGNYYATPRAPVEKALSQSKDILFDIDVKGMRQVKEKISQDLVTVFIMPPSVAEQQTRLRRRAEDSEAVIMKRLSTTKAEIAAYKEFDYVLVNDDLEHCFKTLHAILLAERTKQSRSTGIKPLIEQFDKDLTIALAQ